MSRISALVSVSLLVWWGLLDFSGSIGVGVAQDCLEPPSGMAGWWPGDSSIGGISPDLVGGREAILQNGAFVTTDTIDLGHVDEAFFLDGMVENIYQGL